MNPKGALLPWLIWGLAALFVVLNYVQQVVPNVISADLAAAYGADANLLGGIAAAYFYAYAILQIPVGLIFDRYGTRRPLVVAIMVAGVATVGFGWAQGPGSALAARLIMGAGSAFSFIGCLKLVQEWFPPSRFSTLAGMTNTAGMIGAASGPILAWLVTEFGWRVVLCGAGVVEMALAALVFLIVRDGKGGAEKTGGEGAVRLREEGARLLKNPQVWLNAIYATSISLVFVAFGGLWGGNYIQKEYGLGVEAAASVGSLLFIGGIAGSIFFGWWSDFLGRRKFPMIVAAVGALLALGALLYVPGLPRMGFQVGLFAVGFFSSANIVAYAVAKDLFPTVAGLSIGFLSTCYYAGSAVSQPLVGSLLDKASPGSLASLTTADYRYAFFPLMAFMGVALIASLAMKEPLASRGSTGLGGKP